MGFESAKDKDRENNSSNLYQVRLNIFRKIGKILLSRTNHAETANLLQPFLLNFKVNEYTSGFIEKMVWAEEELKLENNFWHIWKLIYPKIIELFGNNRSNSRLDDSVLINYLLAWRYWGEKQTKWHSLQQQNLWLYENISNDLANHPAVLYSITRVLYSIGSQFHEDGIDWLFKIVSSKPNLELRDLESNTLFYLEVILRQYTFLNREKIKQDFKLKSKIVEILNFMVEKGSVSGYLMREAIL